MSDHVDLLDLLIAADVGVRHADPGQERRHPRVVAGRRDRVELLTVDDVRALRTLHVHERRSTGHGDRFLDAPIRRSALTVAVKFPGRSTPSRLNALKPASSNVMVYVPGRRSTMV